MSRFAPSVVAPAVLVVDEGAAHAEPLAAHLHGAGARPIVTSSVAQALAVLGSFHVDVIVITERIRSDDVLLFLRALREGTEQPAVSVVWLSAQGPAGGARREAHTLRARIVAAPIELGALVGVVRAALPVVGDDEHDSAPRRSDSSIGPRTTLPPPAGEAAVEPD